MGQKLAVPFYCSPTALQRLFHHEASAQSRRRQRSTERCSACRRSARSAWKSCARNIRTPQVYQFYFHKDRGLNRAMMQRAKEAGVEVMMLTVDSITGGNRERDLRTGFSIPFRLTLAGMLQFAIKPMWGINYLTHERFKLPQLDEHVDMSGGAMSIGRYFTEMLDPSMNWDDVAEMVRLWNGQFCLKGVMSVEDAKRAAEIGCTGIVLSNHGGRQLDGSRAPFDQLAEVVDAVGDRLDVMMDGGIQRGTHVLKALSLGAKAVGFGRFYLFPLAAAGRAGVERALGLMRAEIERGMKLMGCKSISELSRNQPAVQVVDVSAPAPAFVCLDEYRRRCIREHLAAEHDVFVAAVLGEVVTDAADRRNEQHRRRDALRDDARIVERAARHALPLAGRVALRRGCDVRCRFSSMRVGAIGARARIASIADAAARVHLRHQPRDDRFERVERCFGRIAELQVELGVARHDRRRVRLDAHAAHRPDAALAATFGNSWLMRCASS